MVIIMENYKQKYKEALERARNLHKDAIDMEESLLAKQCEIIFPELKESWDERIKNDIKRAISVALDYSYFDKETADNCLAWLERQGEIDKASYEIAEKEKNDFVSGQFIECRKSFDVFKEDNSYWFEYIGNDTYIGRSDNILNQKFHITPRQLYRLFTQQHRPKEDSNVNDETNAPTAYGKNVDECLDEAAKHFFSEGEDKYSVADLFYAGVRCGKSWLEKQGQTFTKKDVDDAYLKGICDAKQELEKQGEPAKLSEEEQNRFAKGVLTSCALSFIDYLDAHKYEGKMCVSNGECEDIENAFHNAMWDRLHRYYCKYIEKQGELPISDIDEQMISKIKFAVSQMPSERQDTKKECLNWLEDLRERL